MSFNISEISSYIQANEDKLIGKAIIGSKTTSMLNLMVGVKGTAALNLLATDANLQDGSSCGWNKSGDVTVTKRLITTKLIKLNQEYCDKDLIGSSLQNGVKIAAGMEVLPHAEEFIGKTGEGVNLKVENIAWQGDTSLTGSSYLSLADGFLALLSGESYVDGSVSGKTLLANTVDVINNIVQVIPDEIFTKPDLVIFVGMDVYRKYIAGLQAANLFHYTADYSANLEVIIPGSSIRVVAVAGLNGTGKAVCSYLENMYIGTDLQNAEEVYKFWFDESNDIFKLKILFNLGFQVAFPDLVVIAS